MFHSENQPENKKKHKRHNEALFFTNNTSPVSVSSPTPDICQGDVCLVPTSPEISVPTQQSWQLSDVSHPVSATSSTAINGITPSEKPADFTNTICDTSYDRVAHLIHRSSVYHF